MKTFYVFSLQGFPTLFTDSNSARLNNYFHAHYCHAHWMAQLECNCGNHACVKKQCCTVKKGFFVTPHVTGVQYTHTKRV